MASENYILPGSRPFTPFPNLTVVFEYLQSSIGRSFACVTEEGEVKLPLRSAQIGVDVNSLAFAIHIGKKLYVNEHVVSEETVRDYTRVVTEKWVDVENVTVRLSFSGPESYVLDCPEIRSVIGINTYLSGQNELNTGCIYIKSRQNYAEPLTDTLMTMFDDLPGEPVEDGSEE